MPSFINRIFRNKYFRGFIIAGFSLLLIVALCNVWIIKKTNDKIYSNLAQTPAYKVGLLLGTSRWTVNGTPNLYFQHRLEAAIALYKAGKISHIIVSGDNHTKKYDEAKEMYQVLRKNGVPDSVITLDYAGFRTLDSVVRCLKIFGQNKFIVISQAFQDQRAIFIGEYYKIDIAGYAAEDVPDNYSVRTEIREFFAKFRAVLDLYIFHKEPKFLGKKVPLK